MLLRAFIQLVVVFQQMNNFLGEHTEPGHSPLSMKEVYDLCEKSGFMCIGIHRPPLSFRAGQLMDCVQTKDCLALFLVHLIDDWPESLNFYLITDHPQADLIKLNIFHGNASSRISIESNCSDFKQHQPTLRMNLLGHRLPFNAIPKFRSPKNQLLLSDKYCVWSSESSFFVNNIFRNEASYLYFDFTKRAYDVSLQFRQAREPNASVESFQIRRLSAINLVKSEEPTVQFVKILLSLNLACLIGLFGAILIFKG